MNGNSGPPPYYFTGNPPASWLRFGLGDPPHPMHAGPTASRSGNVPFSRYGPPFQAPNVEPHVRYRFSGSSPDAFRMQPGLMPFPEGRPFVANERYKRPPPPPFESARNRKISSLYCELCKVSCAGPKALDDHERGQKHRKRLAQQFGVTSPTGNKPHQAPSGIKANEFRCPLCDVSATCAEGYAAHVAGKGHQRTLRLHVDLGKPIPKLPTPAGSIFQQVPPSASPVQAERSAPSTQPDRAPPPEPPNPVPVSTPPVPVEPKNPLIGETVIPEGAVGAEYVEKIDGPGKKAVYYRCKLCDCQFTNTESRNLHLTGRRHRLQYKLKVDPDLVVDTKWTALHRRGQPFRRLSGFPLLPDPSYHPWAALLPPGYSPGGPRVGSRSHHWANRYLTVKHAQIVPTDLETRAVKTVVPICEHTLKEISDELVCGKDDSTATSHLDRRSPSGAEQSNDSPAAVADEANRMLCGVVRVGPLGKSLLLRGDHETRLVLVCAEWPTTVLLQYIKSELVTRLPVMDSNFSYEVTSNPAIGSLTVTASRLENENSVNSDPWPTITVHIQVTSPVVLGDRPDPSAASGAVTADERVQSEDTTLVTAPEQPSVRSGSADHGRHLFAHGLERIPKNHCLDALDAIDQAKWFQAALAKPPLGMVARVLVDFMRANEIWLELDEFALLALLDRLLTFDLQRARAPLIGPFGPPIGQMPPPASLRPPFGSSPRTRGSMPSPIGPAALFRRFFEAIASGLLLLCPKPDSGCASGENDKDPYFFAFHLLAASPQQIREAVTLSAQYCLRQIAFKQLDKVLRIKPPTRLNAPDADDDVGTEEDDGTDTVSVDSEDSRPLGRGDEESLERLVPLNDLTGNGETNSTRTTAVSGVHRVESTPGPVVP